MKETSKNKTKKYIYFNLASISNQKVIFTNKNLSKDLFSKFFHQCFIYFSKLLKVSLLSDYTVAQTG